jgi:hypothetical protein
MTSEINESINERLSSWREAAGIVKRPDTTEQRTDYTVTHHRQQLAKSSRLCLENLQAHEQFCKDLRDFVRRSGRDEETQQRVSDYAGYLLRIYESASSRALEKQIFNILQDLPHEVEVVRTVQPAPRRQLPRRSLLDRILNW